MKEEYREKVIGYSLDLMSIFGGFILAFCLLLLHLGSNPNFLITFLLVLLLFVDGLLTYLTYKQLKTYMEIIE